MRKKRVKGVFVILVLVILSISLVSAGFWKGFIDGITGKATSSEEICECSSCSECQEKLQDDSCEEVKLTENIDSAGNCIFISSEIKDKTFDCQGYSIRGENSSYGVYLKSAKNCVIKDCTFSGFYNTLFIYKGQRNKVLDNEVKGYNGMGIYFYGGFENLISNNVIKDSLSRGIYIIRGSGDIIRSNQISGSRIGAYFYQGNNNSLYGNSLKNNQYGLVFYGGSNQIIGNIACENSRYDLYIRGSGDYFLDNTCDKVRAEGIEGVCEKSCSGEVKFCNDTGGGVNDIYNKGIVYVSEGSFTDRCVNNASLKEYYCSEDDNVSNYLQECPNGCQDGACIEENNSVFECKDTDGGLDYFNKGKISGTIGTGEYADHCLNENDLIERHCLSGNNFNFTLQYSCPNGCEDGACIEKQEEVDKCGNLSTSIKGNIKILQNDGEEVVLREGDKIIEGGYVVVPTDDGGKILELSSIQNSSSSSPNDDTVIFKDVLDESKYYEVTIINIEGQGKLTIEGRDFLVEYRDDKTGQEESAWARLTWDPQDKVDTFDCEVLSSCYDLSNMIKNPFGFIDYNGNKWKISYNASYNFETYIKGEKVKVKDYHSSWNYGKEYNGNKGYYRYIYLGFYEFPNSKNARGYLDDRMNWQICTSRTFRYDDKEEVVYLCSYYDESYPEETRKAKVYWLNGNKIFYLQGDSDYWDDEEKLEEFLGKEHERMNRFIEGFKDNRYRWANPYLNYPFEKFVQSYLGGCGSELEPYYDDTGDECEPCWECKVQPKICPPHGEQTEKCIDNCCDQEKEYSVSCEPGICSGCYIPKWLGSQEDRCVPYGFRFTQRDLEQDEEKFKEGVYSDYSLDIVSDSSAIWTFYTPTGNDSYKLEEGETTYISLDDWEWDISSVSFDVKEVNKEEGYMRVLVNLEAKFNAYCDIDGMVKSQKADWRECQNNYECESNFCSGHECTGINRMIKEASGIKSLGIKVLCRLASLFGVEEGYEQCVEEYLGQDFEDSTLDGRGDGSSGGGSGGGSPPSMPN